MLYLVLSLVVACRVSDLFGYVSQMYRWFHCRILPALCTVCTLELIYRFRYRISIRFGFLALFAERFDNDAFSIRCLAGDASYAASLMRWFASFESACMSGFLISHDTDHVDIRSLVSRLIVKASL